MKTAFFGGTFDPPHDGHLAIARAVLTLGLADRVLLAPALRPPHKEGMVSSSFRDRLRMTELAAEGEDGITVTDEETRTEGESYTVTVLDRLSAEHPGETFCFVIGSDSLLSLHTWHNAEKLVSEYGVIVYPRPGDLVTPEKLKEHWPPETAEKLFRSVIPQVREDPSASTEIRDRIRRNEVPSNLRKSVYEYIKLRRLYL